MEQTALSRRALPRWKQFAYEKRNFSSPGGILLVLLIAAVIIVGMSSAGIIQAAVERVGPTITHTEVIGRGESFHPSGPAR